MKSIFILASTTFLLFSCNQNQKSVNRVQYDSLINVINERDESITSFVTAFGDLERNLDSITIKQHVISLNSGKSGEFSLNQKARINNEIKAINVLMNENKLKLDELTKKFNATSNKNEALKKTIETITNQLSQKQSELATLNKTLQSLYEQVEELEISVDFLMCENEVQSDIIENNISILKTAYYVIGKSKMLLDTKIIDKKGGFLGVGRTTEINTKIDNRSFIKIDYTKKTFFSINSKGAKIITSHPSKSYILETDINDVNMVTNLVIIDPPLFWSVSKYLVVVTK